MSSRTVSGSGRHKRSSASPTTAAGPDCSSPRVLFLSRPSPSSPNCPPHRSPWIHPPVVAATGTKVVSTEAMSTFGPEPPNQLLRGRPRLGISVPLRAMRVWNNGRGPGTRQQVSRKKWVTWRPIYHARGGIYSLSEGAAAHFLAAAVCPSAAQALTGQPGLCGAEVRAAR